MKIEFEIKQRLQILKAIQVAEGEGQLSSQEVEELNELMGKPLLETTYCIVCGAVSELWYCEECTSRYS